MDLVNFWTDRLVCVTGGTGFIGSKLVAELKNLGAVVRIVRHNEARFDHAFVGAEVVFHLAGQTSATFAEMNAELDYEANVELLARILPQVAQPENPPLFIHASTATIVGLTTTLPIDEQIPDHPITTYDRHKQIAEQGLAMFREAGLLRSVSLRLTNVYGPGPESSGIGRGLVNAFARKAVQGEPLTLYGEGSFVRDFVYVDDVVAAFLAAAEAWKPEMQVSYFVGSGEGRTLRAMAEVIVNTASELTGLRSSIDFVPEPESLLDIDRRHFIAPIRPFTEATRWRPWVSFESGIRSTVASAMEEIAR